MLPLPPMPSTASGRQVVAAFDFDGTLSRGTSGMRFYRRVAGRGRFARGVVRFLPYLVGYFARIGDEHSFNRFNRHLFRGRDAAEVRHIAAAFAADTLPRHLLPVGMARLHAHRARGDRCVIVSRGFAWCIEPWALTLGIRDVLATRLEVGPDGRLTGEMCEPSCDRERKRTRLLALLGERANWEIYAYGDSAGDHAMLRAADHAFLLRGEMFAPWRG